MANEYRFVQVAVNTTGGVAAVDNAGAIWWTFTKDGEWQPWEALPPHPLNRNPLKGLSDDALVAGAAAERGKP